MANLVKLKEITDWDEGRPTEYAPAYVDIEAIHYIGPHADGDPNHCMVVLDGRWAVGLAVDMDHMANLVNKVAHCTVPTCTPEQAQEIMDTMIRAKERLVRAERQIDNGRC